MPLLAKGKSMHRLQPQLSVPQRGKLRDIFRAAFIYIRVSRTPRLKDSGHLRKRTNGMESEAAANTDLCALSLQDRDGRTTRLHLLSTGMTAGARKTVSDSMYGLRILQIQGSVLSWYGFTEAGTLQVQARSFLHTTGALLLHQKM